MVTITFPLQCDAELVRDVPKALHFREVVGENTQPRHSQGTALDAPQDSHDTAILIAECHITLSRAFTAC